MAIIFGKENCKKMKKSFLLITALIFIVSHQLWSQIPQLSDKSEISVLTIGPGDELYSKFGHSAIRVKDPVSRIDWVFNYGTFDFNTPHFYLKFIRGKLNYMLSVQSFRGFYYEYKAEKRSVYEQVLDLSYDQKKKIFDFLLWNAQPENRYYLYDFLYDNCATRVRDVIKNQLGDSLIMPNHPLNLTFRKAFLSYVDNQPWLKIGINLLNGMEADKKLDLYHAMFLPDYVDTVMSISSLKMPGNNKKPLVKEGHYIYRFDRNGSKNPWIKPWLVFGLLLLLVIWVSVWEYRHLSRKKWIDFLTFFITGLAGTILLGLWLLTDHLVAKNNLNILWLFPLHLIYAFFVIKEKPAQWVKLYANIMRYYYLLFLVAMPFLPQYIDYNFIPIILIILIRLQVIKSSIKQ